MVTILLSLLNVLCMDSESLWRSQHIYISHAILLTNVLHVHKIIHCQKASPKINFGTGFMMAFSVMPKPTCSH